MATKKVAAWHDENGEEGYMKTHAAACDGLGEFVDKKSCPT